MKKLLAVTILLALLLSCAAFAEEKPYMDEYPLENYINAYGLTAETYPQACLTPSVYSGYNEAAFVAFPGPADAVPSSFDTDSCAFINPAHDIQYNYQVLKYAYETFLDKCDKEEDILLDGSEGMAAYIVPEKTRAYGLVDASLIGKGIKVYIAVYYGGLRREEDAVKAEALSALIVEEAKRVKEQLKVPETNGYWTLDQYQGVKLPVSGVAGMKVTLDLPVIPYTDEQGAPASASFIPTRLDGARFSGAALLGGNRIMNVEIETGDYSYVNSNKEKDPASVTAVTLDDGSEWEVYVSNAKDDGAIFGVYFHRLLTNQGGRNKDTSYYLVYRVTLSNFTIASMEELVQCMNVLTKGVAVNP